MDVLDAFACPEDVFREAVANWQMARHQRTQDLDSGIIPLLDLLNAIPGVVSTYSCEGHPDRNCSGRRKQLKLWVRLLATREGVPSVFRLFDLIRHHPIYLKDRELQTATRLCLMSESLASPDGTKVLVPGFSLRFPAVHPHLKTQAWYVFKDCLLAVFGETR